MALYPYALSIRAKTSAGAVVSTFWAGSWYRGSAGAQSVGDAQRTISGDSIYIAPTILGPPTFEKVELFREMLDWSHDPVVVGWRPKLHVEWTQRTTEVLGLGGLSLSNLSTVIAKLTMAADYIELALDGWDPSPHYRVVYLESNEYAYGNIDGKDIGITLALDFAGKALISSPYAVDAVSWGTAT